MKKHTNHWTWRPYVDGALMTYCGHRVKATGEPGQYTGAVKRYGHLLLLCDNSKPLTCRYCQKRWELATR